MKTKWLQYALTVFLLCQLKALSASTGGGVTADLGVTITAGTNTLVISNYVNFKLVLTNGGPSNVTADIYITNLVPAGFQYYNSSGSSGVYIASTGVWVLSGGLFAYSSATQSVTFRAIALGLQTNTLVLTVPAGVTDPNTNNNTASAVVSVTAPPISDLAIGETVSTNATPYTNITVPVGAQLMFVVNVTNLGPSPISGALSAYVTFPAGFTIVTNSAGTYGDTYSDGFWSIPQIITSNAYTLTITAVATNLGTYTVVSSVSVPSGTTDPNQSNNNSIVTVTVVSPTADLAIGKTVNTNMVTVGQQVIFTLSVTNLGPNNITTNSGPVTITDLLPASFQYLTDNGGGAYNASSGIWTLPGLGGTSPTATLQITATASVVGTNTNSAIVNVPPSVIDPNTNNNFSSAFVIVTKTNQTTNVMSASLSGYVRGCATNGAGYANVTITLTGATNLTTLTDTNGYYVFTNLSPGSYAVTPSQTGITFAPGNAIVMLNGSSVTVPPFVGGQSVIQGKVTYGTNGPGIPGVPIETGGEADRTVITDTNGNYIFTNCAPGTYTVFVTATNGYNFIPGNSPALTLGETNCVAQANFIASPRTVQLVALEVTQVIQDWSNSVPLISAKKTYVRAHFQQPYTTNQFGFAVTPAPLLLTGAKLYNLASPTAPQFPLNTDGALLVATTNAASVRGTWTSALDFQLPPSWCSGAVSLQFICTNNVTVVPTNTVPANSTVTVTFNPSPVLPVKYFGWNYTNAGSLQMLSQAAYADLPGRLTSMYPVPDATKTTAIQFPISILNVPATIPPAIAATEKFDDWVLLNSNAKMALYRAIDILLGGRFGTGGNWIYCGAIAGPTSGSTTGWAKAIVTGSNTLNNAGDLYVSSTYVVSNFYTTTRHTSQHEIGHNLTRPHDVMANAKGVCNEGATNMTPVYPLFQNVPPPAGPIEPAIGPMRNGTNGLIYGLDTLTLVSNTAISPVVSPYSYFDIMSYCKSAPLDRWISPFTYLAMQTNIVNNFTPPAAPPVAGPVRNWFYVRGYIDFTSDLGGFLPFWTTSTTSTNTPPGSPAGPYQVFVYDFNGNLIEAIPFAPDPYIVEDNDTESPEEGEFLVAVPVVPNMHAIEIMGTNNQSIATITGSSDTPSITAVTLTSTNGGPFTGVGPLVVSWESADSDPNSQLVYAIQYSTDGGNTWETLDMDIVGTSYQISSLYLPASVNALIRVLASDGFNTSAPMDSSPLVIPNHPPTVLINTPGNGSIYTLDQQIFFDATALDPQDGLLDGSSVQWNSSIDGFLGNGAALPIQASALSSGVHTITVTATDNESLSASASVQIYVLHESLPQLSIQVVGNQVLLSWSSAVTDFALYSTGNLSAGVWTPVPTPSVAADSTQTVTLPLANVPQFFVLQLK